MSEKITEIGEIGNYYGGLAVKQEDGKFYWSIENWDGCYWEEISQELYRALLKHDDNLTVASEEVNDE